MKYVKSRVVGIVLLIISLIFLASGILSLVAEKEGTPLHPLYQESIDARADLSKTEAAITAAEDALTRAAKRVNSAISESNACIKAAKTAENNQQAGKYDAKTDVGALGNAIVNAQKSGADMAEVIDSFAPVVNADLVATLETAKTTVKRAETAVEEAFTALTDLVNSTKALEPEIHLPELPTVKALEVPKLGDLAGVARLMTRAENYLARSEEAKKNLEALNEVGAEIIRLSKASTDGYTLPASGSIIQFTVNRALDIIVFSAIVLAIALALAFIPARLAKWWKVSLFRKGFLFVAVVSLLAAALHYAEGDTWALMRQGVFDTLYMTIPSTFFAYVVGLPLGILLVITSPKHIRPNPTLNSVLGSIVNFLRSIPFIILLVMLFDVTRLVMGTAIGTRAVIFPLFVSAFPYVARIVEGSINEVDSGVIEAAESMGSTTWQIIRKVLIPEALPSLINGAAICMTTILAYTAMAGSAGGDGLGKIAITYGLNYRNYNVMYISSLLLVALVQIIQIAGNILTRALDHRRK